MDCPAILHACFDKYVFIVVIHPLLSNGNFVCVLSYFIDRFITSSSTTTPPSLDPVAITHVFRTTDVSGGFITSGACSALARWSVRPDQ